MVMTASREKGVVKVIHPGKHVETFTKPIPAAQLLNKYPRFCITRPDVFKNPWIVVDPDSILFPGKVFLLVPKRTIYGLMKSSHQDDHDEYDDDLTSPLQLSAGITPKHHTHRNCENPPEKPPPRRRRSRKCSQMESWPQVVCNSKSVKYSHGYGCYRCAGAAQMSPEEKNIRTELKSCMKKGESGGRLKMKNRKVRFTIPPAPATATGEGQQMELAKETTLNMNMNVKESLSRIAALLIADVCFTDTDKAVSCETSSASDNARRRGRLRACFV